MSNLIKKLVHAAHRFTALDFGAFKVCLLSIGILLGAYFSEFFLEYIPFIWGLAILSWVYLMVQVFQYYRKSKS